MIGVASMHLVLAALLTYCKLMTEYIEILENVFIVTAPMLTTPVAALQQDSATCHTSRLVREWSKDECITVVDWPAQSLNLNPFENLCHHVKTMVQIQNPTNVKELRTAIIALWQGFPLSKLIKQHVPKM